ncbi:MAG: hypothetical protein IKZ39_05790 [Lachnospiraceae bacterium]|nr:hypothetical protein [Lachnospiraceae bacterium]
MHKKTITILTVLLSLSLCACELPVSLPIENPLREVDTTPITFENLKEPAETPEAKASLYEKQYAVAPGTVDKNLIYDGTNVELFGLYETQKEIEVVKQEEAKKKQEKKSKGSLGNGNSSKGNGSSQNQNNNWDYYYWNYDDSGRSSRGDDNYTPPEYHYEPPSVDGFAAQVIALVNSERAAQGLEPLTEDPVLSQAAQKRAEEIVTSFSHTRPDGRGCDTVVGEFGLSYYYIGENIAAGYSSPANVITGWMNSPGHRANILHENYGHIGVGCLYADGTGYGYYWVQLFTE